MAAIAPSRDFRLNINEAFNFIARDPAWPRKLGLGAVFSLLSLVLVGAVLVQGYLLVFMERVARAEPEPLPEWDDFGELLRKGLIGWVVSLIYYIPYVALLALIYFGYIGLAIGLPLSGSNNPSSPAILLPVAFFAAGSGLALVVGLATAALVPAAHAQLVLHDTSLVAAFDPRLVLGFIGRYRGQYALAIALYLAANYLFSLVGQLACCIGLYATSAFCQLILAHLIGQFCWRERMGRIGG